MWLLHFLRISIALSHGLMVSPSPRLGTSNAGANKGRNTAPCGQSTQLRTQGASAASYSAGDEMTVVWQTDIAHGGTCRISLAVDGGGVPGPLDREGRFDKKATNIYALTPDFPCCRARGAESIVVSLPKDLQTGNAVVQWFWNGDDGYYNCADITIASGSSAPDDRPDLTNLPSDHLLVGCSSFAQGCNNHGTCGIDDRCDCDEGYFGADCQMFFTDRETVGMKFTMGAQPSQISHSDFREVLAKVIEVNEDRLDVLDSWQIGSGGTNLYLAIRSTRHSSGDEPDKWSSYSAGHIVKARFEDGRLNRELWKSLRYNVTAISSVPCEQCDSLAAFLIVSFIALFLILGCAAVYIGSGFLIARGFLPADRIHAVRWLGLICDAICSPCDSCRAHLRPSAEQYHDLEDGDHEKEKKRIVEGQDRRNPADVKNAKQSDKPAEADHKDDNDKLVAKSSMFTVGAMGAFGRLTSRWRKQGSASSVEAKNSMAPKWQKQPSNPSLVPEWDRQRSSIEGLASSPEPKWQEKGSTNSNTSGFRLPVPPWQHNGGQASASTAKNTPGEQTDKKNPSGGHAEKKITSGGQAEKTTCKVQEEETIEEEEVLKEKRDFMSKLSMFGGSLKQKAAKANAKKGAEKEEGKGKGKGKLEPVVRKSVPTQADDGKLRVVVPYEERDELEDIFYDFCFPNNIPMEAVKAYAIDGTWLTGEEDPRDYEDWWPISFVYDPKAPKPLLAATKTIDSWE